MEYKGLQLDKFQAKAALAINEGHSVLVAAPTGTGKTLVADYLVDRVLSEGGHIVYTAPIKALSNQKYRDYVKAHGEENVGLVTGDIVIRSDAPLLVMTTEILRNILLQGHTPDGSDHRLEDLKAVIFDELHFLDDPDRGTVWEEVLIYLPQTTTILGLSATLPNIKELAGWLNHVRPDAEPVEVIQEPRRAVPLKFMLANREAGLLNVPGYEREHRHWVKAQRAQQRRDDRRDNRRGRNKNRDRYGKERNQRRGKHQQSDSTSFRDLVRMLRPQDLPALFFVFSRKITERFARSLARGKRKGYLSREESHRMDEILLRFEQTTPGVLSSDNKSMYRKGIAFHHAGLHVQLKVLVEKLYEQKLIKILFCTSTFALGINMPARTVIFERLEKFNGTDVVPLTVRQFMQKAGRAGRRGLDKEGQVILAMDFANWGQQRELVQKLMSGQSEPAISSFNLSFHSVVNLLERFSEAEIRVLLDRSFLAYQRAKRQASLEERIAHQQERVNKAENAPVDVQEDEDPDEASVYAARKTKKLAKRLARLERKLERERTLLWNQFQAKVNFLKKLKYMEQDGSFNTGARIVSKVQIEEIFVAEMILAGVFEDLTPAETYALCAGLVQEFARQVEVKAKPPTAIMEQLDKIEDIVTGPELATAIDLTGGEPHCDMRMMSLGYMWAMGSPLSELIECVHSHNDVSGDLVGALRRAKDLVNQLRLVFWDDETRRAELRQIMKEVSRDEVEAV